MSYQTEIEEMKCVMHVDEYLPLVKKWKGSGYDVPFDDGYNQAKKDVLPVIERAVEAERERIHKFVRKDFHADFVKNGLALRFYKALTPPTK